MKAKYIFKTGQKFFTFLIFTVLIFLPIYKYKDVFLTTTPVKELEKKYSQSQYILGDASINKINDGELYIYAGYAYMKGENPANINFEHPPLGKYLFGLSQLIFNNSQFLNIPVYILNLFLFYGLIKKLSDSYYVKIGSLITLGTMGLFQKHISLNFLDLFQLLFILLFYNLLFSKKLSKKGWLKYSLIGIVLGLLASTKYYFPILGVFLIITLYWSFKEKCIKKYFYTLFYLFFFYLLTYLNYFLKGNSLLEFTRFEWYRFNWWIGDRTIPKFLIFDTIFLGKFKGWWDDNTYQFADMWTPLWGMLFIAQWIAIFIKKNIYVSTILFYNIFLTLIYAFGSAAYERYLIIALPFWIILTFYSLEIIFKTSISKLSTRPQNHLSK